MDYEPSLYSCYDFIADYLGMNDIGSGMDHAIELMLKKKIVARYCSQCKEEYDTNMRFCRKCGAKLEDKWEED